MTAHNSPLSNTGYILPLALLFLEQRYLVINGDELSKRYGPRGEKVLPP